MPKTKEKKIAVIDAETDPFKYGRVPKPFLWGYYNGEIYEQFDTTQELVDFISERDEIIYAHNGGKFDFFFLLEHINRNKRINIINGRIAKCKVGECELRDSWLLFTMSLDKYAKTKIDYSIMEKGERDKPKNRAEIAAYLNDDCVFLYELVKSFVDEYGLFLTQAGAAMSIWENMSDRKWKNDAEHYKANAKFYYGGRTQAFYKGEIPNAFDVYDINSAYPAVMKRDHPCGPPKLDLWRRDNKQFAIVEAKSIGVLPYRNERGGLDFPDDGEHRIFSVTGWELNLLEKLGGTFDVIECYTCPNTVNFSVYVNKFYKMKTAAKKEGDKLTEIYAKIFLNSLYGKFAANPENYEDFEIIHDHQIDDYLGNGWNINDVLPDGSIFVNRPTNAATARYYDVLVAASITGAVRANLALEISRCDQVYYCDTDSLACTGFKGERDKYELGKWDLEARCKEGYIGGKKLYAFLTDKNEHKTASKGTRLNFDEIKRVAMGAEVEYKNIAPTFSVKQIDKGTGEARFVSRKVKAT